MYDARAACEKRRDAPYPARAASPRAESRPATPEYAYARPRTPVAYECAPEYARGRWPEYAVAYEAPVVRCPSSAKRDDCRVVAD